MNPSSPPVFESAREAAADWCGRLSEGPLGLSDQQVFQDWLDSDPRHPALFERTVVAWMAIEDQASQPEMLRMRGDALDRIHRAGRLRWKKPKISWKEALAIAASLVLFIGTAIWWRYAPTVYETGVGERQVVALTDGSTVSLDAATRIDVRYRGDRRELWLDHGRAKFSVAKDPLRPFSVQAANRMVIATGTQFSVEKLSADVRVILYEGHVAVMDTSRSRVRALTFGPRRAAVDQALVPGRELIIADEAAGSSSGQGPLGPRPPAAVRVVVVDAGRSLEWEGGLLEFSDEPLGSAAERMNRYGTHKIRIDSASVRTVAISGQFEGGNTDAFVEGVTSVFPVKAVPLPNGDIELRATQS